MNPARELKKIAVELSKEKNASYKFNFQDVRRLRTLLKALEKHQTKLEDIYEKTDSDTEFLEEVGEELGKDIRNSVDDAMGLEYQINFWLNQNNEGISEKHIVSGQLKRILEDLEAIFSF